jgi:uncharacterized damage-inducible protein DinB
MNEEQRPEPWLRGTLAEMPAVPRAVIHALELASEDVHLWCGPLTDEEMNLRPLAVASVAFHIRHIARSIDRLLNYAESTQLSGAQMIALKTELDASATRDALFAEFDAAIEHASERIRALDSTRLDEARKVGRRELPASVGGLLVHVADHTQRHVGQAITTAKIVVALRDKKSPTASRSPLPCRDP